MTAKTTTALVLAAFALVGLITTGATAVAPGAFAQTSGTETETTTTEQSGNQSEVNGQSNDIDQDQTGAINEEIGSGSDSSVSSDADSNAESNYKTKYKSNHDSNGYIPGTTTPGSSSASSSANSDVSNTGTLGQNQELNNPTQVNDNTFGNDESRAATVGFDLEFEQAVDIEDEVPPTDGDDGDDNDGELCILRDMGPPELEPVTAELLEEIISGDVQTLPIEACIGGTI